MQNSIKIGSNDLVKAYYGSNEVAKIYLGSVLLYPTTTPTEKLATPQNVSATGTVVTWNSVTNATSYAVYVDYSLYATTVSNAIELTAYSKWATLTVGVHAVTIVAQANGYQDSNQSEVVAVAKTETPTATNDQQTMAYVTSGALAFGIINHDYNAELSENFDTLEFSDSVHNSLTEYNFNRTTAGDETEIVDVAQIILNFFCCIMQKGYSKLDDIQAVLNEITADGSFDQIIEKIGTQIAEWINEWIAAATEAGTYTELAYQEFISTESDTGNETLKDKMNNDAIFLAAREDFKELIAELLGITVDQLTSGNW